MFPVFPLVQPFVRVQRPERDMCNFFFFCKFHEKISDTCETFSCTLGKKKNCFCTSLQGICIRAPLQEGIFIHLVLAKCIFYQKIPLFCSAMSEGHVQKKQLHFPESSPFREDDVVNTKQNNTAVLLENIKAH